MNPIIIANPLDAEIVALSGETREIIAGIVNDAKGITAIRDVSDYDAANLVVSRANRLAKDIEAERKRLKAPVLELSRSLDDAAGEAIAPLAGIKMDLGRMILGYQEAENRRRQEEYRRQQEAARMAAEEARKREETARAAIATATVEDLPPPDEAPVHVPEVLPPAPPKMMKSSAVTQRTIKEVVIDDATKIPHAINGAVLLIPDTKAIKKLLEAGMAIPGCRLVDRDLIAAK